MDLFNFDLTPDYVDRYAGVSNFDKFRKMNTRSNVNMIIDRFLPFSKAKRAVNPVGTIISMDDTNIYNSDDTQGIFMSIAANRKNKKLVVNTKTLGEQMEAVNPEDHGKYFEAQSRFAYGCFSNLTRCAAMTSQYVKAMDDGLISESYMALIEITHQLAKARVHGYIPDYSDMLIDQPAPCLAGSATLAAVVEDLIRGEDITLTAQEIDGKDKSSGDWSDIEGKIAGVIQFEIDNGEAATFAPEHSPNLSYVPQLRVYQPGEKQPGDDKASKEVCEVGNDSVTYDETPSFSEKPNNDDTKYEMSNDILETDGKSSSDYRSFFEDTYDDLGDRNFEQYDHLVDALYESLVGRLGKKNSQSPAKRLNKRNVASDISDNIYVSTDPVGGKNLNINVIIDTSGSMAGHYIDDAVYITYVFNELARRGVVKGNIMLSCKSASGMWEMPMNKTMLHGIVAHNGGEGFRHTMGLRYKEMIAADYNVAITDGQLTDGHIDLAAFEASGIFVTGMYVKRGIDNKNLTRYTNGLNKWFSKSIVRGSVDEAIYSVVDQAILQLGSGGK